MTDRSIGAVLFDLDDTLYDRGAAFRSWAGSFVATHLAPDAPETHLSIVDQLEMLDNQG